MLARADSRPTHYSLNTNYVEVKVYTGPSSSLTYNMSSANAEAWQDSAMPTPTVPGTVATAGIGIMYFKETAGALKIISLGLIIMGIIGLNLSEGVR